MPAMPEFAAPLAGIAPSPDAPALARMQAAEADARAAAQADFNNNQGAASLPGLLDPNAGGGNAVDVLGPIPPRDLMRGRPLGELPPDAPGAPLLTVDDALAASPAAPAMTPSRRAAARRVLLTQRV